MRFFLATYRLFKLPELEEDCEDFSEAVIYKGTMHSLPESFSLDIHHTMETDREFPVCRNTLLMLMGTRFSRHFDKVGDGKVHNGICRDCGKSIPFVSAHTASIRAASSGTANPVSYISKASTDLKTSPSLDATETVNTFLGDPITPASEYSSTDKSSLLTTQATVVGRNSSRGLARNFGT